MTTEVNVMLRNPGSMEFTVKDATTGQLIKGAILRDLDHELVSGGPKDIKCDGHLILDSVRLGRYPKVRVEAEGYLSGTIDEWTVTPETRVSLTTALYPKAHFEITLEGRVLLPNGEPAKRINVSYENYGFRKTELTDERGYFAFKMDYRTQGRPSVNRIIAIHPDYAPAISGPVDVGHSQSFTLQFSTDMGGITGSIKSKSGSPIEANVLYLPEYRARDFQRATCSAERPAGSVMVPVDSQGEFSMKKLPPGPGNLYVCKDGKTIFAEPIDLKAGSTLVKNIVIKADGMLLGKIRYDTGNPVRGVRWIRLDDAIEASFDTNGNYRFPGLAPRTYEKLFFFDHWNRFIARNIEIIEDDPLVIDAVIPSKRNSTVAGKVFDANGNVFADARIIFNLPIDEEWTMDRWSRTQKDGTFRVPELPAGKYKIQLEYPIESGNISELAELEVPPDKVIEGLEWKALNQKK